jgi:type II secretory pathway predicted ATPase ExeA
MVSELIEYYGLTREFDNAGYFETQEHQKLIKELKAAVKTGRLVALAGIVGCGKTTILRRIQEVIVQEKEILVSKSLSVDKGRVNLGTLIMALFYDLSTEKDFKIPVQPEKRERKLRDLIVKCNKPIALFIDEAHDLHSKTLVGLKRLMEVVQDSGGTLSIVLVGHPKLKNDLRRPTMEEIGARSTVFVLEGLKSSKDEYIQWLLTRCTQETIRVEDIFTAEAIAVMTEKLTTPLQMIHYLNLAFEEAYKIGVKPVTSEVIESILARDIDGLEPRLTRYGYNVKALSELLNVRPAEIKSFLHGQLTPGRAEELKNEMLAAGLPL